MIDCSIRVLKSFAESAEMWSYACPFPSLKALSIDCYQDLQGTITDALDLSNRIILHTGPHTMHNWYQRDAMTYACVRRLGPHWIYSSWCTVELLYNRHFGTTQNCRPIFAVIIEVVLFSEVKLYMLKPKSLSLLWRFFSIVSLLWGVC